MRRALRIVWVFSVLVGATGAPRTDAAEASATITVSESPDRLWTDDSGYHQVRARLVEVGTNHVRLLKGNGRYATVPMLRLSASDQQFVAAVRSATLASEAPPVNANDRIEQLVPPGPASAANSNAAQADSPAVAYLDLSREMLRRFTREVNNQRPVATCVLGVPVTGVAVTTADLDVELVPHQDHAVIEVPIVGSVQTHTTGLANPVQVHTSGTTDFAKRVRVSIGRDGARLSTAATQSVSHYTTTAITTAARAFRRLILRVSARRVAEQKPASDAESARQQRQRLDEAFEEKAEELVERLDTALTRIREEIAGASTLKEFRFAFSTSANHLKIAMSRSTSGNIDPPPSLGGNDAPLILRMHVTAFEQSMREDARSQMQQIAERLAAVLPNAEGAVRDVMADADVDVDQSSDGKWIVVSVRQTEPQLPAADAATIATLP